jgi:ATP-dependent exoDNAse (exonuclease V) beta subunit
MKAPGHQMILASAGSGKTYALTNRFVQLLALGARPERIAALTFTRKAAGEFFDEILGKLARAASDPHEARVIAGQIEAPGLAPADFTRMLRAMVEAMPRLSLGTLDSFFARVVRAFPLELGLGGDFEILQEHASRIERRRVVRRIFAVAGPLDAAQRDFIEAFKRATFGAEEKRLSLHLDGFLDDHVEIFLAAPDEAAWGRADRIWPEGNDALAKAATRGDAQRALQAALPWEAMTDGQRLRWEDFFAALSSWAPGAPLPDAVKYVLKNAQKVWPEVAEIMVERKKSSLPPAAAAALRDLVSGIIGAEFARRLEMTRGIFAILRGYEAVYDGTVRRLGRLTFSDLQRLLLPAGAAGARRLSREAADEARLFIDWRLDAQIDHWLLDEFQDTSFDQWRVLRNLIDEAVQDPSGTRSFFYVGDVKQAIYAWREGDAGLFLEIFHHYNAAAPRKIGVKRLDVSYRSGGAVIAMVNRVMGDRAALGRLFPAPAVARWVEEWHDHASAWPDRAGYAELRLAEGPEGRFAETLRILQESEPLQRGLDVAVLVRTNETASALADFLRREGGFPAVAESDLRVGIDNPLTCALLALFRAAAHPGDTSARALVRLTPLEAILREEKIAGADSLTRSVLGQIHEGGFERTVEAWLRRIEPFLAADDAFSRERGRQLANAGRLFDQTGGRDVAEFVAFVERYTERDSDAAGAVRIMTVHKAKGLGFDLVILPDLEGQTLAKRRSDLAVQQGPDRSVQWVMDLPALDLAMTDPVLAAHIEGARAEACYENLCLLYVALTRAKTAMYVVTEPVGRSQSANFPRLLQETLGEAWSAGDPRWFEGIALAKDRGEEETGRLRVLENSSMAATVRRPARRPSASRSGVVRAADAFALDSSSGTDFGTAVHSLLAGVEWADAAEVARLASIWEKGNPAAEEALACLAAPGLAEIWRQPEGEAAPEVWRERSFELVLEGAWVSGIFDRVTVVRDSQGRAQRAAVWDFKTDALDPAGVEAAIERHRPQLEIYRQAVARLTGLPLEAVAGDLVLTRLRRRAGR